MLLLCLGLAGLALLTLGMLLDGWERSPILIAPGAVLVLMVGTQFAATLVGPG
jgi:hypothetical protein